MNIKEIKQQFKGKASDVIKLITPDNAAQLLAMKAQLRVEQERIDGIKEIASKIENHKERKALMNLAKLPEEFRILKELLND